MDRDIVACIDGSASSSNQPEVDCPRILTFHPKVVGVGGIKDRDTVVSCIGETHQSCRTRRYSHLQRGGNCAAHRFRGVLGNFYIAHGAVCSETWTITLEAIVAKQLPMDTAITFMLCYYFF